MNQREVLNKLQSVFDDVFIDKVTLTPELNAREVREWDSLMQITLVVAVEKTFSIRFESGEVVALSNVGEFATLIAKRVSEARGH